MMDMGNESDWEDEVQDGLRQLPPGEEGFLQSHWWWGRSASCHGWHHTFVSLSFLHYFRLIPPFRKRVDSRTRKDLIQQRVNAWRLQIPALAEQYLKWKAGQPLDLSEMGIEASWEIETLTFSGMLISICQGFCLWHCPSDYSSQEFSHISQTSFPNESLVRNGFLGSSPEKPTLAIAIEVLEIYRQFRRVCPRFSLDALGRALCHIHHVKI